MRAISANIQSMTDEFEQRLTTGVSQVGMGMATANPLKFGEGLLTVLGLETNNSATQRLVAADFETFLTDELNARRDESGEHKRRLDTFEQRLATMTWLVEDFEGRLGEQGARPSDLIALLAAGYEVWKSTADAKKRGLLGNALRNAFDPKQYEEGLTLRLLDLLAQLDYGDVWVLRCIAKLNAEFVSHSTVNLRRDALHPEHQGVALRASGNKTTSLIANHVKRLSEHGLVVAQELGHTVDERDRDHSVKVNVLTELGARFLKLVADRSVSQ